MPRRSFVFRYVAAALIVIIMGGFLGWYLFVRQQVSGTQQTDTARGYDATPSFGSALGSTLSNIIGGGSTGNLAPSVHKQAPKLWVVNKTPVAGLAFEASSTKLFFVERSSGNVLRADPSETTVQRLTNTLFPKIYEALIARDGAVVLRSVSDTGVITSFAARLATSSSPNSGDTPYVLAGTYLPQGIVSVAQRQGSLAFIIIDPQGGGILATSDWRGGAQKKLLAAPLSNWQLSWNADGTLYLAQSPSDSIDTYAFTAAGGVLRPYLRALPGLQILPRDNSTALIYSTSSGGSVTLFARASAQAKEVALPIHTIASKCAWAPGSSLVAYCAVPQTQPRGAILRALFSGQLHTSDAWWRVDVSAGTAEQVYLPDPSNAFDVENPAVDANGAYIAFMNASDKSLWMLHLVQ